MPGKRLSTASLRLAALLKEMHPDVKLTPAVKRALGERPISVIRGTKPKESDRGS